MKLKDWEKHVRYASADWSTVRDAIDLAAVATNLLGPAPGRRGERGRRLWWPCPFHRDRNPSFCVDPGKPFWRCYGCNEHGDAANLVMRLNGWSFPEAKAYLAGELVPSGANRPRKAPGRPPERSAARDGPPRSTRPPRGPRRARQTAWRPRPPPRW